MKRILVDIAADNAANNWDLIDTRQLQPDIPRRSGSLAVYHIWFVLFDQSVETSLETQVHSVSRYPVPPKAGDFSVPGVKNFQAVELPLQGRLAIPIPQGVGVNKWWHERDGHDHYNLTAGSLQRKVTSI